MNRILRIALILVAVVAINGVFTSLVLAQASSGGGDTGASSGGGDTGISGGLTNPLNGINTLPEFLNKILEAIVTLGSIVLTLALVYVGFLFVKAQGNEEQLRSARGALMWTVIGGLVLLGASTIGKVIETTVESLK